MIRWGVVKRAVNGFLERIERILAASNPFNLFPESVDSTLVSHLCTPLK